MIKYKIIKEGDGDVTFEKTGDVYEVTKASFNIEIARLAKIVKEVEAQEKLESSKIVNYKQNNACIAGLSMEDMHAIHLCYQSMNLQKKCADKLKEIADVKKSYDEAIVTIKEQTGIDI